VPDVLGHEDDERETVWLGLIEPDAVELIVGDAEEEGDDDTETDAVPVIVPEPDEEEDTLAELLGLFETLLVKVPDTETVSLEDALTETLALELGEPDTEEQPELVTEVENVADTDEDSEGD
jgi:hypothetical protein